jgi:8-oxo-dGTP diphosphatase
VEADAFGGVLLDDLGRILLREPRGGFGGYAWTFPKGRPQEGDTPEVTACREVEEETGYRGQVLGRIPGTFRAEPGATRNVFFLMRPCGDPQAFDSGETQSIRWVSFTEARQLIGQTPYRPGRYRDLEILEAAEHFATSMGLCIRSS